MFDVADRILVLTVLVLFCFGGYLVNLADRFFAEIADASHIEKEEPKMAKVLVLNTVTDEEILKEIHQYQKEYQDAEIFLYRRKDKKQIFDHDSVA